MKRAYELIFEDNDLLIVNKPSGLLAIPDRFDADKPNLYHLLQQRYGEIFIVHRLDRETSGIICFAKNEQAHRHLSLQFEQRKVQKIYKVLVQGRPVEDTGEINHGIAKHPNIGGKMIASAKGKPSLTHYQVLERFKQHTLLEADIKTGRTHQIRVHFAAIGHPLTVDSLYSKKDGFFLSEIKRKRYNLQADEVERPLLARTSLHAFRLQITQPTSGELLQFEADLHKDFRATVRQLQKLG